MLAFLMFWYCFQFCRYFPFCSFSFPQFYSVFVSRCRYLFAMFITQTWYRLCHSIYATVRCDLATGYVLLIGWFPYNLVNTFIVCCSVCLPFSYQLALQLFLIVKRPESTFLYTGIVRARYRNLLSPSPNNPIACYRYNAQTVSQLS